MSLEDLDTNRLHDFKDLPCDHSIDQAAASSSRFQGLPPAQRFLAWGGPTRRRQQLATPMRCLPALLKATSGSSRVSSAIPAGGRKTSRRWPKGRRRWPSSSGCADSRVSPELIFDQGVGDLFVVRVAGNVVSGAGPFVKGSIEFAVAELGARLIMVLGHRPCGAVKAAIEHIDANDTLPGSIRDLVDLIRPAAVAVRGKPGDKLENVIKANVKLGVERLKGLDPILAELVKKGELKVVGAVYELRTGVVKWLD